MARWKARVEFLLSVSGLLFLSLMVEALQGKTCQNSLLPGGGRSLGAKISGGRGRPWGIFFGFYKTRHIFLSNSANWTMVRAVVLTQYRRVTDGQMDRQTDGQTDGIDIASTALRALRRAVKNLTQQMDTFTNRRKCSTTQNKHKKIQPGLVTSYNIQPGNGGPILVSALHKFVTYLLT